MENKKQKIIDIINFLIALYISLRYTYVSFKAIFTPDDLTSNDIEKMAFATLMGSIIFFFWVRQQTSD